MLSTFHGLETARKALNTTQTSLHTVGHNIANANTEGYSRQRVNTSTAQPFPSPGFNKPGIPGQMGTGVEASSIQRIRDEFLDLQYRGESTQNGYWSARHDAWVKVEDIMNEPTEEGLANQMDQFWESLQDLSVNPEDAGARSVVKQKGIAVAETFNYTYNAIEQIQRDYGEQVENETKDINSLLRQINNLNRQISAVEPHAMMPNDLYDRRDSLVDQLSSHMNIKVDRVSSGGNASSEASGKYTITLLDDAGRSTGIKLVDGSQLSYNELKVEFEGDPGEQQGLVKGIRFMNDQLTNTEPGDRIGNDENTVRIDSFPTRASEGSYLANIRSYGYVDEEGNEYGVFPEMLQELDTMVNTFTTEFNDVHRTGWSLSEIENGSKHVQDDEETIGFDFFAFSQELGEDGKNAAKYLKVHDAIMASTDNIAASGVGDVIAGGMEVAEGSTYDGDAVIAVNGRFQGNYDELSVTYDGSGNWSFQQNGDDFDPPLVFSYDASDADAEQSVVVDGLTFDFSSFFDENGDLQEEPNDNTVFEIDNLRREEAFAGDGSNALALAGVKDTNLDFAGNTTNIQSYYQAVIGEMAVQTSEAGRLAENTDVLRESVNERRLSVSSVSLDEEMTMMIQFQHAYNAAARSLTAVDEMLDRIINQMGLVGR